MLAKYISTHSFLLVKIYMRLTKFIGGSHVNFNQ